MKIAISGWYGAGNLGDEAILTSMLESISSEMPGVSFHIFSKEPKLTSRLHRVESSSSSLSHALFSLNISRECDALVLGGGGFLHKYSFSALWMFRPMVVQMMEKPVAFYSLGIDRSLLERRFTRWLVARIANRTKLITVRDVASGKVLEEMGVGKEIHVTADPALALKPSRSERIEQILENDNIQTPFVIVCPGLPGFSMEWFNMERYLESIALAVDYLLSSQGFSALLVPFKLPEDLDICDQLANLSSHKDEVQVLSRDLAPKDVLGLFSRCELALGARYHANIFAITSAVPCVSIMYLPEKHMPLLERAGIPEFGVMPQNISADVLIEKFDYLLATLGEVRKTLLKTRRALESSARMNAKLLAEALLSS